MEERGEGAGTPERLRGLLEELPEELAPPAPESPAGRILAAARDLAAESGLEGISMRAVAEGAGVNQAMIHYYFGSKEKMIGALVRREILCILRDVVRGLDAAPAGSDLLVSFPLRLLDALRSDRIRLRLVRRVLATHPDRLSRAIHELGRHGLLGSSRILLERIESEREEGSLPGVEPRSVLLFLLSSVYGLVLLEPVARTLIGFHMEDDADWRGYGVDLGFLIGKGLRGGAGREE
ncbi:MAG: TetR/AcrR family transcriptional regulator [Candidatus Eisenbacteria bacterium]|nr:TetR/AcrR family transcriptional regulator [Candidatus Eisenbacteria bacterium]